jgi:hypothetical protein
MSAREAAHTPSAFSGGGRVEPLEQDEGVTLEAELRQAMQHRRAAIEQARETQAQLESLIARARVLLNSSPASTGHAGRRASAARGSSEEDTETPTR